MIDLKFLKRIIKNLKDCEDVPCENTNESVIDDAFQRVLLRNWGSNIEEHGILYVNNTCEALQKQIELCGKRDIMFRLERKELISKVV